ncbi:MAG TPA: hypothetical protein VNW97_22510 [Candidatus Saccharimonadales bacterium]|nr:hypothetical protein [Candidatus Saccharimonadales bacterium]
MPLIQSMFFFGNYSYGLILMAMALTHFARRRPDNYWLWIILMGGGLGALAYLLIEAAPDLVQVRQFFRVASHRSRIKALEVAILDNPSAGNLEELGDLYLERKKYGIAKGYYDRAISSRTDSPDPFYRRSICEIELGDFAGASTDLERVVGIDKGYDYGRAGGLLAHAWAGNGKTEESAGLFERVTQTSTLSETQYNYANLLMRLGKPLEARQWLQRILQKKATMPRYLRRRERMWFWKATLLLKKLPANAGGVKSGGR